MSLLRKVLLPVVLLMICGTVNGQDGITLTSKAWNNELRVNDERESLLNDLVELLKMDFELQAQEEKYSETNDDEDAMSSELVALLHFDGSGKGPVEGMIKFYEARAITNGTEDFSMTLGAAMHAGNNSEKKASAEFLSGNQKVEIKNMRLIPLSLIPDLTSQPTWFTEERRAQQDEQSLQRMVSIATELPATERVSLWAITMRSLIKGMVEKNVAYDDARREEQGSIMESVITESVTDESGSSGVSSASTAFTNVRILGVNLDKITLGVDEDVIRAYTRFSFTRDDK